MDQDDQIFAPDNLKPGFVLDGYVVLDRLGAGGFGTVYKVRRERAGEVACLKICREPWSSEGGDTSSEERALREVGALTSVRHPNILRIYGYGHYPTLRGHLYLVTEYIEGWELHVWVRKTTPTLRQIVEVFIKVLDAVGHMNRLQIYHRDLKPSNIMVRADGEPFVLDLGLARMKSAVTVTRAAAVMGTPNYFSPEYAQFYATNGWLSGEEKFQATPATELYALGVTFYEILSGRRPYERTPRELGDLLEEILKKVPVRPTLINPNVPGALCDAVMQALAKNPAERQSGALEMKAQLEAALAHANERWDVPFVPPPPRAGDGQTANARRSSSSRTHERRAEPPPQLAASSLPLAPLDSEESASPAPGPQPPPAEPPHPPAKPPGLLDISAGRSAAFVSVDERQPPPESEPGDALVQMQAQLAAGAARAGTRLSGSVLVLLGGGVLLVASLGYLAVAARSQPQPQSLLQQVASAEHRPPGEAPGDGVALPVAPGPSTLVPPPARQPERQEQPAAEPEPPPPAAAAASSVRRSSTRRESPPAVALSPAPAVQTPAPTAPPAAPAPTTVARGIRPGTRCKVELRRAVQAGEGSAVPVEVLFRQPCFTADEREVVGEASTAAGEATAKDGRVHIRFNQLQFAGGDEVAVHAIAMQGGQPGVPGIRALSAPAAAGAETLAAAGRVAAGVLLGELPSEAQQLARGAQQPGSSAPESPAAEVLSLQREVAFYLVFKESL